MKLVIVLVTLAFGGTALGATPKESKRKRLDFLVGSEVSTQSMGPRADPIEVLQKRERASLIEVRKDFVPELMRSAE